MRNVGSYEKLLNIAQSAYGSGIFEGSKGGNGYVGQYTDAAGKTHTVKMLTHRAERNAYANASASAHESWDMGNVTQATEELKAKLIEIAGGEESDLGRDIKKMLEDAQKEAVAEKMFVREMGGEKVGLLSRKIVAKAVSTIAEKGTLTDAQNHNVTFSWNAVNGRNRAETVSNTTIKTVKDKLVRANEDRAQAEMLSAESKFGDWALPLSRYQEGMGSFPRVIGAYLEFDAQSKNVGPGPCCKRMKEILSQMKSDASEYADFGELEEALNKLDDNLNANELLKKLEKRLDVKFDKEREQEISVTLAFRAFLEKLALSREEMSLAFEPIED